MPRRFWLNQKRVEYPRVYHTYCSSVKNLIYETNYNHIYTVSAPSKQEASSIKPQV